MATRRQEDKQSDWFNDAQAAGVIPKHVHGVMAMSERYRHLVKQIIYLQNADAHLREAHALVALVAGSRAPATLTRQARTLVKQGLRSALRQRRVLEGRR